MRTLHIAPGHSAGGSLRHAIRGAGRNEEILFFRRSELRSDWFGGSRGAGGLLRPRADIRCGP